MTIIHCDYCRKEINPYGLAGKIQIKFLGRESQSKDICRECAKKIIEGEGMYAEQVSCSENNG